MPLLVLLSLYPVQCLLSAANTTTTTDSISIVFVD